jgi:hypothetical protein
LASREVATLEVELPGPEVAALNAGLAAERGRVRRRRRALEHDTQVITAGSIAVKGGGLRKKKKNDVSKK